MWTYSYIINFMILIYANIFKNNLLSNNTSSEPMIEIYVHTSWDYSQFDFTYNNLMNNNASTYYYPHTWDPINFSIENVYWGTTVESEIQNLVLDCLLLSKLFHFEYPQKFLPMDYHH